MPIDDPVSTQDVAPDYQVVAGQEETAPGLPEIDVLDSPLIDRPNGAILFSFGLNVSYITDMGLRCSPVASSLKRKLLAFWRTSSQSTVKVVTWIAQQFGDFPPIPDLDMQNDNEVLVAKAISFWGPETGPEGDLIYGCCGQYLYALQLTPDDDVDEYLIPNHPLLPAANRYVNVNDYMDNFVGPTTAPSDFTGSEITF